MSASHAHLECKFEMGDRILLDRHDRIITASLYAEKGKHLYTTMTLSQARGLIVTLETLLAEPDPK